MPGPLLDFTDLKLTHRPNQYLVAPDGLCRNSTPHDISAVYPVPPAALYAAWRTVIAAAPRTTIIAENSDGLEIEAVQRSAMVGFRDRINFAAFAADKDHSSLAIYSRSQVGYSDLGANKARIRRWLEMLDQALNRDTLSTTP